MIVQVNGFYIKPYVPIQPLLLDVPNVQGAIDSTKRYLYDQKFRGRVTLTAQYLFPNEYNVLVPEEKVYETIAEINDEKGTTSQPQP